LAFTLFVNGTPDLNTTCGRDSGANRTIIRQFVKLCKGDILTMTKRINGGTIGLEDRKHHYELAMHYLTS
jgi:hypothetical protein